MKAIILARVSTKEQEEGHSIGAQRRRLSDYCARKDLDVIRTFERIESSTSGQRKDFMAMLEFARTQDETIAIVADAVDRFQRSFKESVLIDELIRKEQVELHFISREYGNRQKCFFDRYSALGFLGHGREVVCAEPFRECPSQP